MDQEPQEFSQSHSESSSDLPFVIQDFIKSSGDFDPCSPLPQSVQFPLLDSIGAETNVESSLNKLSVYMRKRTYDLEQIAEEDSLQPEFSDITELAASEFRRKSSFMDSLGCNNLVLSNEYDLEPETIYRTAAKLRRSSRERIARRRTIELANNAEMETARIENKLNFSEETYEAKTDYTGNKHATELCASEAKFNLLTNSVNHLSPSQPQTSQSFDKNHNTEELVDSAQKEAKKSTNPKITTVSQFDAKNLFKKKMTEETLQIRGRMALDKSARHDKTKLTLTTQLKNSTDIKAVKAYRRDSLKNENMKVLHSTLGKKGDAQLFSAELSQNRDTQRSEPNPQLFSVERLNQAGRTLLYRKKTAVILPKTYFEKRAKTKSLVKSEIVGKFDQKAPFFTSRQKSMQTPTQAINGLSLKTPFVANETEANGHGMNSENLGLSYLNSSKVIFSSHSANKMPTTSDPNQSKPQTFANFLKRSSLFEAHSYPEVREDNAVSVKRNQRDRIKVIDYWIKVRDIKKGNLPRALDHYSTFERKPAKSFHASFQTASHRKEVQRRNIPAVVGKKVEEKLTMTRPSFAFGNSSKISVGANKLAALATGNTSRPQNSALFSKKISQINSAQLNLRIPSWTSSQKEHSQQSVSRSLKLSFGSEYPRTMQDSQESTLKVYTRHSLKASRPPLKLKPDFEFYAFLPSNHEDAQSFCPLFAKLKQVSAAIRKSKVERKDDFKSNRQLRSVEDLSL